MKRRPQADWTTTLEGRARYTEVRGCAQAMANRLGMDVGVERNDLFKTFRTFVLPRRENRYGFELRCEVVSPEDLSKCLPGHGPVR